MMREVVRLVLDTMRVGDVWFCFLQRPRLIAVYEVRVLGRQAVVQKILCKKQTPSFFIFPHFF